MDVEVCTCGHTRPLHSVFNMCSTCHCGSFTPIPEAKFPKPKPMPKPPAPTFSPPDHITRDVRKFALSQAVKALPGIRPGMALIDVAAEFEDYVMNGKKDK